MLVGLCTVQSARFFLKFITEPIEISFLIIRTDAYRLGLVFRHIAVRFNRFGCLELFFLDNTNTKVKTKNNNTNNFSQPTCHAQKHIPTHTYTNYTELLITQLVNQVK